MAPTVQGPPSTPTSVTADAATPGGSPVVPASGARGWRAVTAPLALGAVAACGCAAVALADPGDDGVPLCWSRSVFGVDCPFCGGLRTTNALLRGHAGAALDHNVVLAVALPVVVMLWVWWLVRRWRGVDEPPVRAPAWIWWTAGALLVAFGVVRNLGGPAWVRWLHSDSWA